MKGMLLCDLQSTIERNADAQAFVIRIYICSRESHIGRKVESALMGSVVSRVHGSPVPWVPLQEQWRQRRLVVRLRGYELLRTHGFRIVGISDCGHEM